MGDWYDDRENLCTLLEYLDEKQVGPLLEIGDVLYILEKPWKYEDEFKAAVIWKESQR